MTFLTKTKLSAKNSADSGRTTALVIICNMKLISDQLKKTDFSFLNNLNVDNAHEAFTNLLTQITDTYAPLKEVKIHPKNVIYNPWMTPALLQSSMPGGGGDAAIQNSKHLCYPNGQILPLPL